MQQRSIPALASLSDSAGILAFALDRWYAAHGKRENESGEIVHSRTSAAYEETMTRFLEGLLASGLDLDSDPVTVALLAEAFARQSVTGKQVAKTTYNQRLSCLSSFYRFAREKKWLRGENPIEIAFKERHIQAYAHAEALEGPAVKARLAQIDQSTQHGCRDYALLAVLLQTARRAREVATLQWQHVAVRDDGTVRLTFGHTKGDEIMQDDLPPPVAAALLRWLRRQYGETEMSALPPATPLWVSLAHGPTFGAPLGYQAVRAVCLKYLGTSKVHVTRHTASHAMEKIGLSMTEIQTRLGHKSLDTTGRYLASLRRAENRKAAEMAAFYGIE